MPGLRLAPTFVLSLALIGSIPEAHAETGAAWESIRNENGIEVWQRSVVGTSVIEFRGRGNIDVPLLQALAVLVDTDHNHEWMKNCAESYVIERQADGTGIAYSRTKSPVFFVSDRDAVVTSRLRLLPEQQTVRLDIQGIDYPPKPVPAGVVRLASVTASWTLRQIDSTHTEVTYQVLADPSGSLPKWLVNSVAADLPFYSLSGLRRQSTLPRYVAAAAALRTGRDWTRFSLPADPH